MHVVGFYLSVFATLLYYGVKERKDKDQGRECRMLTFSYCGCRNLEVGTTKVQLQSVRWLRHNLIKQSCSIATVIFTLFTARCLETKINKCDEIEILTTIQTNLQWSLENSNRESLGGFSRQPQPKIRMRLCQLFNLFLQFKQPLHQ